MKLSKSYTYFLIGGGKFLFDTAIEFKKKKIKFEIILSIRHYKDLIKDKDLFIKTKKYKISFIVLKNINKDTKIFKKLKKTKNIALCFGPAWIFSNNFLKLFDNKIFNINCIPLPYYMGGAHFTWQILNNSKDCGIYLQQITNQLDQGSIYLGKKFKILKKNPTPSLYFNAYDIQLRKFIKKLIFNILNNIRFKKKKFKKLFNMREYFPRLNSSINGYINWQWSTIDIIKFCNAFDKPYRGASTFLNGRRVFLKNVSLYKKKKISSIL